MRLLEGQVEDERDARIAELEDDVRALRKELASAKAHAAEAQRQSTRGMATLRRQLSPLYRALQDVFGELDTAGVSDESQPSVGGDVSPRVQQAWQSWKTKLGGTVAKGIDALLIHGELDTGQLAIAAGFDRRTVTNTVVYKLHGAGLINKSNGRFSLKSL